MGHAAHDRAAVSVRNGAHRRRSPAVDESSDLEVALQEPRRPPAFSARLHRRALRGPSARIVAIGLAERGRDGGDECDASRCGPVGKTQIGGEPLPFQAGPAVGAPTLASGPGTLSGGQTFPTTPTPVQPSGAQQAAPATAGRQGKGLIVGLAAAAGVLGVVTIIMVARGMKPKDDVQLTNPFGGASGAVSVAFVPPAGGPTANPTDVPGARYRRGYRRSPNPRPHRNRPRHRPRRPLWPKAMPPASRRANAPIRKTSRAPLTRSPAAKVRTRWRPRRRSRKCAQGGPAQGIQRRLRGREGRSQRRRERWCRWQCRVDVGKLQIVATLPPSQLLLKVIVITCTIPGPLTRWLRSGRPSGRKCCNLATPLA